MAPRPFVREFIWRQDEEHGTWGWAMKDMPHFNAVVSGGTVYHDVLEHLDKGTAWVDELQALGAMIFFRVGAGFDPNDRPRSRPVEEDIGSDLTFFTIEQLQNAGSIAELAPLRKHMSRPITDEVWVEDSIKACIQSFYRDFESERAGAFDEAPPTTADMVAYALRMSHWLRVGFRRARHRWGDNYGDAYSCAYTIRTEVDRWTKVLTRTMGDDGGPAGARLKVRYWPSRGKADVDVYFDGHSIKERW